MLPARISRRVRRVLLLLILSPVTLVSVGTADELGAQGTPPAPVPAPAPRDSVARTIEPQHIRGERGTVVVGGASAFVVRTDSLRAVAPSLADVLRSVPLILVRTNSRGEIELSVRGSESRQVGIMLDGLPLSPGWDGRADPSLIPLSGISQLTYVRATSSVLGGPNTLGGVIDLQIDSPTTARLEPRLALGSDETGARLFSASVASTAQLGEGTRLNWRVGGGLRELDGIVRARGVPDPNAGSDLRTNTDVASKDAFASVGWRAPNGAALSALITGYDMSRGVAPELHLATPRLWRYPRQARRAMQLRGQSPLLISRAGTTQLEVSGGLLDGETHIEAFSDATYSTVTGTEDGDESVGSTRVQATHTLSGGARFRAAATSNRVTYTETLNGAAPSKYGQTLLSAGAEAQVVVGARTLLSGGIVYDRAETVEAAGRAPLGPKDDLGWRLGATVQASDVLRVHASASRRARFPALRELYSGALNRFEPNPVLRPERLLATELGVSFGDAERPSGVLAQVTAFHHSLEDGIVRVGVAGTNRFTRINRDETRSVGAEAMLAWRGSVAGPAVTLDVVAQRVRIADATAGGTIRRPEHMPNLRAMLDGSVPLVARLRAGASLTHIGGQYCVNPELGRDVILRAQTVGALSLQRTWALGSGAGRGFGAMRVLAGMDNVTNAGVYEQCGLPRAGRTLRLGVDLH